MRHWYVVSPEYGTVIPVLDWGQGPTEYGADVVEIEAATRHDALVLGVREMRRLFPQGWHRSDPECNPFAGVRVIAEDELEESNDANQ